MDTLFIDAEYTGNVELCRETIEYLKFKKYKKIGLYASVQFVHKLAEVKKQLTENGIGIITSKPDRANAVSQLLGCDNFHYSLNLPQPELEAVEAYLYIGDGRFHPLALVYGQKDRSNQQKISGQKEIICNVPKEIICNDPIQKKMFSISENDVKIILNQYKSSLMKFLTAQKIGVIVTIKPGQEQFKPALQLEQKFPEKKFYYFIDNNVSFDQLENFPFIEVWVNTACPRIGLDDQKKFAHGVININDALRVEELLQVEERLNLIKNRLEQTSGGE